VPGAWPPGRAAGLWRWGVDEGREAFPVPSWGVSLFPLALVREDASSGVQRPFIAVAPPLPVSPFGLEALIRPRASTAFLRPFSRVRPSFPRSGVARFLPAFVRQRGSHRVAACSPFPTVSTEFSGVQAPGAATLLQSATPSVCASIAALARGAVCSTCAATGRPRLECASMHVRYASADADAKGS
jgi:hypothetical protein